MPLLACVETSPNISGHGAEKYYGFYTNIWSLELWRLDALTEVFFAFELIYAIALGLTKISLTFLYLRILEDRRLRIVLWATQALNVLVIISYICGMFTSCTTLAAYWTFSYVIDGSSCPDLWNYGGYYTGFNIFLDVWLIILPAQYVWKNMLDARARIGVIAMFCFGLVYTRNPPYLLLKAPNKRSH